MARTDAEGVPNPSRGATTIIHLGVADVKPSAALYEALLGGPPRFRHHRMVVFEAAAPPLALLVFAHPDAKGLPPVRYALDVPRPEHVGSAAVALRRVGARLRLQDAGFETSDPDGNTWRIRFVPRAPGMAVTRIPEVTR
jgi:hypothetical protein